MVTATPTVVNDSLEWNEDDDPADLVRVDAPAPVAGDTESEEDDEPATVCEVPDEGDSLVCEVEHASRLLSIGSVISKQLHDNLPISPIQEREITEKYFVSDHGKWCEIMVMSCSRFAYRIARKYYTQAVRSHGMGMEDLFQRAMMGISDAAGRYTPDKGTRFLSFAGLYAHKYMKDLTDTMLSKVKVFIRSSAIYDAPVTYKKGGDKSESLVTGDILSLHRQDPGTVSYGDTPYGKLDRWAFLSFLRRRLEFIMQHIWPESMRVAESDKWRMLFDCRYVRGYQDTITSDMFGVTKSAINMKLLKMREYFRNDAARFPELWSEWIKVSPLAKSIQEEPDKPAMTSGGSWGDAPISAKELSDAKTEAFAVIKDYGVGSSQKLVKDYSKFYGSAYQRKPRDLEKHYRPFYGGFYSEWSRYHRGQAKPVMTQRAFDINVACGNIRRNTPDIDIIPDK